MAHVVDLQSGEFVHAENDLKRRGRPRSMPFSDEYEAMRLEDPNRISLRKRQPDDKLAKPLPRRPLSSNKASSAGSRYIAYWQKNEDLLIPLVLTLISFWTRFYAIGRSNIVVWDEAHFGKFGSHYIKREFYFDVHPPLGKILVGFSGLLAGYNGNFEFKSGEVYPDSVNYTFMRVFSAIFGALMVPLAYETALELKLSRRACLLAACMVLLDTAYLCISRFILLDSMLLFFTCSTLYCLSVFHNLKDEAFSLDWWIWLAFTGLSLGCVSSVKWVGFFIVALVGLYTIEELWEMFGDLEMPFERYLRHWIARILCLIVLPILVYIFSFALHFAILNHSGPGDAQMSSLFQARLKGNNFDQNPLELAYGSKVTFKNYGYGGGLLHSHVQSFPTGSEQQQVTCYHYKDNNNDWVVKKTREASDYITDDVEFVKNGDTIRLVHDNTGRNLHSHAIKAPVTQSDWEISCYGNETVGDNNDYWIVEVVDDISTKDTSRIRSLTTRMRFRHQQLGCYLSANNVVLPQWGFRQVEVTCDKRDRPHDTHQWWNIEQHWNDKLPPAPRNVYRSHFFKDFWHLNVAMWVSNNALIPDPDKEDILSSAPTDWPLLLVGLRMCGWGDDQVKFYLLGNPIVWWSSTFALVVFLTVTAAYIIRLRRQIYDMSPARWEHFLYVGKTLFLGWLLHYIPFGIMGRVTYLHHYFPALYFAILMVPFLLDHITMHAHKRTRDLIFAIAFFAVISTFLYFSPLAFGVTGPIEKMRGRQTAVNEMSIFGNNASVMQSQCLSIGDSLTLFHTLTDMQLRDHDNKETDVDTGDKRSHADQGKHDSKKQKTKQEEDNIGNETLDHKEAEDRGAKPHDESNGKLPKSTPAKQNKQASRPKRSEKTGDLIFEDYPEFRPNLTPKDVLQIGSFGGTYFRPIHSQETGQDYKDDYKEFPDDWFEGLDIGKHVISPDYDANINRFKVKCGQTLEQWEEQGWIRDHDPRGWFQWYCRFYEGRRCEDDAYQASFYAGN
ncbi:hypothetical protein BZG36_00722 [Bifiguratus adelaidae]|uniref:dolichyl-phosphate-mannose--protein mannosyltransferase n=1 Tax=Bifiguratus adelaidae TaxID=1938954 RepID=A0A261Y6U3_9FUNG|nr:hypothetical protein BZG36_00722 [Bifiguratus adelaidae]